MEPKFKRWEVVRVVESEETTDDRIAGLVGVVRSEHENGRGGWYYSVKLDDRNDEYLMQEDEIESTGLMEDEEELYWPDVITIQVDPETGEGRLAGEDEFEGFGEGGIPFHASVYVRLPPDAGEGEGKDHGVLLGKALKTDGTWRYAVGLMETRRVQAFDEDELDATVSLEPDEFPDRWSVTGIEELEAAEGLEFTYVWDAPPPRFATREIVRIVEAPETLEAGVAGREGPVRASFLEDDLIWSYTVDLGTMRESPVVAEPFLEPTGRFEPRPQRRPMPRAEGR